MMHEKYCCDIPMVVKECADRDKFGARSFCAYAQHEGDDLIFRVFALRYLKGKEIEIKECSVISVRSGKCEQRDILCTYLSGYVCLFTEKDSINHGYHDHGEWYECDPKYNPNCEILNDDEISKGAFRYCGYGEKHPFLKSTLEYLRAWIENPKIEFFGKLGITPAKSLVSLAEKDGQFRRFLFDNKEICGYAKPSEILYAYRKKMGIREAEAELWEINQVRKKIPALKGTDIDRLALARYLRKNGIVASMYDDYLKAIAYLKYDLADTKNIFPSDFTRMHDLRTQEYGAVLAKEDRKKRRKLYSDFKRTSEKYSAFFESSELYTIILPHSPADLVKEGKQNANCVGKMGYDKKMAEGKTLIAFCRKSSEPTKSYITIEIDLKNLKILQAYAKHNTEPDESAMAFINSWQRTLKNRVKTEEQK